MNIEERMDAVKVAHKTKDGIFIVVEYDKAVSIAKEYAEEMCKKQRDSCAFHLNDVRHDICSTEALIADMRIFVPLATDKEGGR